MISSRVFPSAGSRLMALKPVRLLKGLDDTGCSRGYRGVKHEPVPELGDTCEACRTPGICRYLTINSSNATGNILGENWDCKDLESYTRGTEASGFLCGSHWRRPVNTVRNRIVGVRNGLWVVRNRPLRHLKLRPATLSKGQLSVPLNGRNTSEKVIVM